MSWPAWIETLKDRYLGEQASVFLLHGAGVATGRWDVDGQTLDCLTTLNRFLRGSRQILGVLDPALGLSFADPADRNLFRGLVEADRVLSGSTNVLRDDQPREALAMVYKALHAAASPAQGYVLLFAEALGGKHQKAMRPLPEGVPALSQWPATPAIREGDKVVVMLAEHVDGVHPELLAALGDGLVHVGEELAPVTVTDEVTELPELYDLPPAAAAPAPVPSSGGLAAAFVHELREALAGSVEQADALPVRTALARVLHAHGRFEGTADGEAFAHWYASDIVLGAAAGQLMDATRNADLDEVLHENAQVRVLVRRLERVLESP